MAQIILVMIWVVLPPAGEEYCCIQKVLFKPYLQLPWYRKGFLLSKPPELRFGTNQTMT